MLRVSLMVWLIPPWNVVPHQGAVHQSDPSLVCVTDRVRLIKLQHYQQQGHPTWRRFPSIANSANVQLSTYSRRGERDRKYISVQHAMNKSEIREEMHRETFRSESLGTTRCCHHIMLHYIHQPLHFWSCGRARNQRLSQSAAGKNSSSFWCFFLSILPCLALLYLKQPVWHWTWLLSKLRYSTCLRSSESERAEPWPKVYGWVQIPA